MCKFFLKCKAYFTILGVLGLISACSELDSTNSLGARDLMLVVKVNGIKTDNSDLVLQSAVHSTNVGDSKEASLNKEVIKAQSKFGELEIELFSVERMINDRAEYPSINLNSSSNLQKLATSESMSSGTKYGFLIYDNSGGQLLDAQIGTVGVPLEIGVPKGGSFTWYAYSFNSPEITLPDDLKVPDIRTKDDKPLLYKSGTITTANSSSGDNLNLEVIFNHVLPKIDLVIDTRRMFADIQNIDASFEGTTLATGLFNLKTGAVDPTSLIGITNRELEFENANPEEKRITYLKGDFYTANITNSFSVRFSELTVVYPDVNSTTQNIANALFSPDAPSPNSGASNTGLATFSGYTPLKDGIAKALVGKLQPSLIMRPKSFVLYGPPDRSDKGFQAVATSNSGDFIRSDYNFGRSSDYIKVKIMSFDEVYAVANSPTPSNLAARLENPANYPDVVICSMLTDGNTTAADLSALETYLLKGGVVFLLTETLSDVTRDFLRNVLEEPNLSLARGDNGGAVYRLGDVDPQVLNGLFGDVRGAYWGQDGSPTQFVQNISKPENFVIYTEGASNATSIAGVSMFRHKIVNLFFAGDTGFLAGPKPPSTPSNQPFSSSDRTGYPYATKGGIADDKNFPISRGGFGITSVNYTVSNSIIFANVLAWLLERAEFRGVDKSVVNNPNP